jgi:phosphoribosylglycinamide formyltransferase 1
MTLQPIHDPANGQLRLVALMSGSGTNLRRLLELEYKLISEQGTSPFTIAVIFTDNAKSQAPVIGAEYDIPVVMRDIGAFYKARNKPRKDLEVRALFDKENVQALAPFNVKGAAYAGYMSIVTESIIDAFLGFNVHPADLSVEVDGQRKYTGDFAVRDAILAGEKTVKSTTHIVTREVDGGPLLMISEPLEVQIPADADLSQKDQAWTIGKQNQERLKKAGDWVVFPRTIREVAEGHFAFDEAGVIHYKGQPFPKGIAL